MRTKVFMLMALGASAWALAGCGDDPLEPNSSCMTIGPVVEILDNHLPSGGDHQLDVPAADVVAATERVYDIRGDNVGHTHSVTITANDFVSLQNDVPVTVVSTNNGPVGFGHDHSIQLSCP